MILSAEEVLKRFKEEFKDKIIEDKIREQQEGVLKKTTQKIVFMKINRDTLHKAVAFLKSISYPHISVPMSYKLLDDYMQLVYFFCIFGGEGKLVELPVIFEVLVPKNDLHVPTLTDLVPGVITAEREMMEMLGVKVDNIPDSRRMFTPHNLDSIEKGMLPLRDDLGFGYDDFYKKRKEGN